MAMMTLRRLAPLIERASHDTVTQGDVDRLAKALDMRRRERGPSKLARRITRKAALGMNGAF